MQTAAVTFLDNFRAVIFYCDANLIFFDVACKWPGSCHDSFYTKAI